MRKTDPLWATLLVLLLAGCQPAEEDPYQPGFGDQPPAGETLYLFGVHPLHNPQRLFEFFNPLMEYLSAHIPGGRFKLEASRNYAAYNEKLYAGRFHFALPNPFQTVNAVDQGYRVFAKMGDDDNFHGIILVRRDSGIEQVSDLKGKAVSYPAPTALAATMLPQYHLHSLGLDVMHEVDNRYVGSQESSVMNVFLGNTAAGATWPPPWRALKQERPELEQALEVKWRTPSLPNNGLVVRSEIPQSLVVQVRELLVHLHETPEGRTILERLELSRFEPADDETYAPVRSFIHDFSARIRPVE